MTRLQRVRAIEGLSKRAALGDVTNALFNNMTGGSGAPTYFQPGTSELRPSEQIQHQFNQQALGTGIGLAISNPWAWKALKWTTPNFVRHIKTLYDAARAPLSTAKTLAKNPKIILNTVKNPKNLWDASYYADLSSRIPLKKGLNYVSGIASAATSAAVEAEEMDHALRMAASTGQPTSYAGQRVSDALGKADNKIRTANDIVQRNISNVEQTALRKVDQAADTVDTKVQNTALGAVDGAHLGYDYLMNGTDSATKAIQGGADWVKKRVSDLTSRQRAKIEKTQDVAKSIDRAYKAYRNGDYNSAAAQLAAGGIRQYGTGHNLEPRLKDVLFDDSRFGRYGYSLLEYLPWSRIPTRIANQTYNNAAYHGYSPLASVALGTLQSIPLVGGPFRK